MMQQAQDFLEESEALHALVAPLADAQFDVPSGFKQWTPNNVVGHLHMWNYGADLALKDTDAFKAFLGELRKGTATGAPMTAFEKTWRKGLAGRELVSAWREFYTGMAGRFGAADPSKRVAWAGPDMSVRSSITARLMETWAHGQALYDMLGERRVNTDRIRNIVVLGVNTYGWTFKVRSETPPQPKPHLALTAPSGEVWCYHDDSTNERIEGLAEEFCQVVTQVRNIADTALKVTGANATAWMAKAQCFAGGAETPPAPGTRKMAMKPARTAS